MKHFSLLLLFLMILMSSCSREYIIERKENKLIGTWVIDKVKYKKRGALFPRNITDRYEEDIIVFYGDHTALYDDYDRGILFDGGWRITTESYYDVVQEEIDSDYMIEAWFNDPAGRPYLEFYGGIKHFTRSRFRFEVFDGRGIYTFTFERY